VANDLESEAIREHDDFFASFFSKKNDERNNASILRRGNPKK